MRLAEILAVKNDAYDELLALIDEGFALMREEFSVVDKMFDPREAPRQFLDALGFSLGLPVLAGFTDRDKRAILEVLAIAFHFKGTKYGFETVVRSVWKVFEISLGQDFILNQAISAEVASVDNAFLTFLGFTEDELYRVNVKVKLEFEDLSEYGDSAALDDGEAIDDLESDENYVRVLQTFRPAFSTRMTTLLGASQVDGVGITNSSQVLYGYNFAFFSTVVASILQSLVWANYPQAKLTLSERLFNFFLPRFHYVEVESDGFRADVDVYYPASESISIQKVGTGGLIL